VDVRRHVVDRTDGMPLFVADVTTGALEAEEDGTKLQARILGRQNQVNWG
jgi:hypothetical protein